MRAKCSCFATYLPFLGLVWSLHLGDVGSWSFGFPETLVRLTTVRLTTGMLTTSQRICQTTGFIGGANVEYVDSTTRAAELPNYEADDEILRHVLQPADRIGH